MLPLDIRTEIWEHLPSNTRQRFCELSEWNFLEISARLAKRHNWISNYVDAIVLEYKRYMGLTLLEPNFIHYMGGPVDEVWHEHLIDTFDYYAFCSKIFGHFVHHVPEHSGEVSTHSLEHTWQSLCRYYNSAPEGLWLAYTSISGGKCKDINMFSSMDLMLA